jgi:hypothetical protein
MIRLRTDRNPAGRATLIDRGPTGWGPFLRERVRHPGVREFALAVNAEITT